MEKTKKLIIIGDSAFAEIAYEYFTHDSNFQVIGFSVEKEYLKKQTLFDLTIVPFEELEDHYDPSQCYFYVAIVYTQLNRLRTRLYAEAKKKGYQPASYISSKAFVWNNCQIGEHSFIFENNVIQPFVKIGNNVILWSGNHIGHHSIIDDNCFISSHVVISGFVEVGKNCFMGVNATIANNVKISNDCLVGAGTLILKDTEEDKVIRGIASEAGGSAKRISKVKGTPCGANKD